MLTTHKYIDCGCNPPNKYWEKTISSNICCVPPRVIFVFVFILQRSLINSNQRKVNVVFFPQCTCVVNRYYSFFKSCTLDSE